MKKIKHHFMSRITNILNSGQSKSVALTGNINDLFLSSSPDSSDSGYTPFLEYLLARWMQQPHYIKVVCEFNKRVEIIGEKGDAEFLKTAWQKFRVGADENYLKIKRMARRKLSEEEQRILEGDFDQRLEDTAIAPSMALEFLRQLCMVSRAKVNGKPVLEKDEEKLISSDVLKQPHTDEAVDSSQVGSGFDWRLSKESRAAIKEKYMGLIVLLFAILVVMILNLKKRQ